MPRRSDALVLFDALSIEGGLLPPEWLAKVAALEAPPQKPADYDVPRGLELRDEITRYWRIAEALRADFVKARAHARDRGASAASSFARSLLSQVFGFTDIATAGEREEGGRTFDISFEAAGRRVPIVVGVPEDGLDNVVERHGDGARRRSAWGVLQEYLNASDAVLWGVVTNGAQLRIGRDNTSLTRPAWIEADLDRIFEEERFADFSILWLILHASRFGRAGAPVTECPLEAWRDAAREAGTRAREDLRKGVEEALLALGGGFLAHPSNVALRSVLASRDLTPEAYFNELLRLVYRMIFLLTVEERGILHDEAVSTDARSLYADGYGMRRLREHAIRRGQHDRHTDLWESLRPVFASLGRKGGEPTLGLPELGGLFAPGQCPHLDASVLENRALLGAVFRLAWIRDAAGLARVNWKDMGPEELGSVYESLLELVPVIGESGRSFAFAGEDAGAGNARRLTGSYYTPDSLVQQLLDTALEPVIADRIAANPDDPASAILDITVVDPACGSGHFLLGAARRLASHLARIRSGGTPGAHEYRSALRDVVTHCIHGVDRNPMALELARMSLWLESYTPDRALGFLDHHLVLGDALLGLLDLGVLKDGIPDDAYKALAGDDREVANTLRRVNREGRRALEKLTKSGNLQLQLGTQALGDAFAQLDELADDAIEGVEAKRARYEALRAQAESSPVALAADLFLGAFLLPKRFREGERAITKRAAVERFPATGTLLMALDGTLGPEHSVAKAARRVCRDASVMHWPLAFPQVLARGGFDVVLGNPPWETLQLSEAEFFGTRASEIAALSGARRKAAIAALENEEPLLWRDFVDTKFRYEAFNESIRANSRFQLTAFGKLNMYSLFAETAYRLAAVKGRAGLVLPTGIATDDSTKRYFAEITQGRLVSLIDFRTGPGLFSEIGHQRYKFCLLTLGQATRAEFAFFLTEVSQLQDRRRFFHLTAADFRLLNPNTLTCPIFRTEADAELTKKIYRNVPVLIDETKPEGEGNPWGLSFSQGLFNMTSASGLFQDERQDDALPLYEAKMIHQFDHRWATYEPDPGSPRAVVSRNVTDEEKADSSFVVRPRYWVPAKEVRRRAARVPRGFFEILEHDNDHGARQFAEQWIAGYHLNRGDTTRGEALARRSTPTEAEAQKLVSWASPEALEAAYPLDSALVSAVLACETGREMVETLINGRTPLWFLGWRDICRATDERTVIASVIPPVGVGNKIPLMFMNGPITARQVACLLGCLDSLVLDFAARQKIGGTTLNYFIYRQLPVAPPQRYAVEDETFIANRVLELTYTAGDLRPWAAALGYTGSPFAYEVGRRAQIRAELDAYYARLYGLTRNELRYILDPTDVRGPDYPSETFRVLKQNEEREYGEYRTRRLVLEAWDRLEAEQPHSIRRTATSFAS